MSKLSKFLLFVFIIIIVTMILSTIICWMLTVPSTIANIGGSIFAFAYIFILINIVKSYVKKNF